MKSKKLNKNKDASGQIVWAHFNNERSYEVIERDDGFIDISTGAESYFSEFKDWPKYQKEGLKFAKGKALDIGAGAGRVALYLQKKGVKVTAIDNSPLSIKVCKKRGVKSAKVLPIEEVDSLPFNSFDTILMYGNNFGLFANPKKAKNLLKKFYKITKEDAIIITESRDPYKTKDPAHLNYHKLNKKRGKLPGALKIRVRFKNYTGNWFEYLFVSKKEMKDILKDTEWKIKKFVESDSGSYIAIIEKQSPQ